VIYIETNFGVPPAYGANPNLAHAHFSMSTTKLEKLKSADYKALGGKLVRIRLKEDQGQIRSVKITGDFFLIPEESLGKLEKMLEDVPLREPELRLLVDRFFRGTGAQGLGVSSDDFVKAILSAKETV